MQNAEQKGVGVGVSFERFMTDALYGPAGFYNRGGRAGRRGDFITSPEVGPLFGTVVARFLDAEWRRLGEPDQFTVVDVGAGPGTLARSVLAARPACREALRYVAVEVSAAQRAQHPPGVESVATPPSGPYDGVVIANELLDNLPFRLAVHDGGWREAFVVEGPAGRFVEHLGAPLDPCPEVLPERAPLGARAPLHDGAVEWVADAMARLGWGTVVAIDYTSPTTEALARRPWREWLRTYRGHGRGDHYLAAPGSQDITTEVALDQLPPPTMVTTQADWLRSHGLDELVGEGKRYWGAHAARPGLMALQMRSRVAEAEALTDVTGLGTFTVMEWRVDPS